MKKRVKTSFVDQLLWDASVSDQPFPSHSFIRKSWNTCHSECRRQIKSCDLIWNQMGLKPHHRKVLDFRQIKCKTRTGIFSVSFEYGRNHSILKGSFFERILTKSTITACWYWTDAPTGETSPWVKLITFRHSHSWFHKSIWGKIFPINFFYSTH